MTCIENNCFNTVIDKGFCFVHAPYPWLIEGAFKKVVEKFEDTPENRIELSTFDKYLSHASDPTTFFDFNVHELRIILCYYHKHNRGIYSDIINKLISDYEQSDIVDSSNIYRERQGLFRLVYKYAYSEAKSEKDKQEINKQTWLPIIDGLKLLDTSTLENTIADYLGCSLQELADARNSCYDDKDSDEDEDESYVSKPIKSEPEDEDEDESEEPGLIEHIEIQKFRTRTGRIKVKKSRTVYSEYYEEDQD